MMSLIVDAIFFDKVQMYICYDAKFLRGYNHFRNIISPANNLIKSTDHLVLIETLLHMMVTSTKQLIQTSGIEYINTDFTLALHNYLSSTYRKSSEVG